MFCEALEAKFLQLGTTDIWAEPIFLVGSVLGMAG